ncbi:CHAP domain-containing protein [Streptococcus pyogenes]|uniref:CHAP domain-containing protein n=1 Tax=Streptococcus pyogenes TaxID=1314 RepID=UPI0007C37CF6|nr:CHAP domain-containing protein [Streptococcus pyogenes]OAC59780.1 cell wall hydrolase [Streptococcus pyogenes]OAC62393.1 cell wall hydrolase [Streptococcus pyogenes]OAC63508.1 cell wall hydrolase [Streptococcus pyogenes]OAC73268.1 cell wall hydrolase [Streptococcus pyogenes]SUO65972.1 phage-associated cell wall hydrolase [Streptococcus pyogenes]
MATLDEVLSFAKGLADTGQGVDLDNVYGTQCVDLPNWITTKYFGIALWGNAIDLLDSAAAQGMEVVYNAPGVNPRAGAIFVMVTYAHGYGHTGLVIVTSDGYVLHNIEQNVDGNADALYIGGPARYVDRPFEDGTGYILGWFYPPYDSTPAAVTEPSAPVVAQSDGTYVANPETGTFTVRVAALNVRSAPRLDAEIVATYGENIEFNYDGWIDSDGYIWVTYISVTGVRRYVSVGNSENGRRVTNFGTFR